MSILNICTMYGETVFFVYYWPIKIIIKYLPKASSDITIVIKARSIDFHDLIISSNMRYVEYKIHISGCYRDTGISHWNYYFSVIDIWWFPKPREIRVDILQMNTTEILLIENDNISIFRQRELRDDFDYDRGLSIMIITLAFSRDDSQCSS